MTTRISRVRLERRTDAALADTPAPRLSWEVETDVTDWRQDSAQVRLDGTQTVTLDGSASQLVAWPFPPLAAHARHSIEVRVTGTDGETSGWSEPLAVRSAFLEEGEWQASFIGLTEPDGAACPGLLRTEVDLPGPVRAATLYATAAGVYQASINGTDVDDGVLKPGWTVYQERLVHEATDVTALLQPGRNALGLRLAGGWWTEQFGFHGQARRIYGDQPAAAAQLHIELADGTVQVVSTGGHWRGAAAGPITASGIYAGEDVDARRALPGWDQPGFDDTGWTPVRVAEIAVVPEPAIAEPVRRTEMLPVQQVLTTPSGKTVLDFGQNLVGRLRLRVQGPAGHTITVRHAEVLEHGELGVRPLRHAKATDTFTCSGNEDAFEPEFTFHGFRYAEVTGWPGDLDPEAITAVVVGSDMRRTGWFSCSDERVNRLHENVVWGMRGNFLSLPTDCPQRDERMGWTGDIQVFSPTATTLFDCDAFLASWLRDVAVEQRRSDGICPIVVPMVLGEPRPTAAWGDAATVVPTVLFERYADRRALAEQFPWMKAWVDVLVERSGERMLWEGDFQFGDWLDPAAPPDRPGDATTDKDIVASAHLVRSADLVASAAAELGRTEDEERYRQIADRARQAWQQEYVTPAGRIVCDSQTAYAMAIAYGLVDDEVAQAMGDRLAALLRQSGFMIGTGFVGTPIIADALCSTGHADAAGRLLLSEGVPSWLYAVTMGATTIWERWDSMLPDGSINPGEMTSFNHYAFGAVADWLHRRVAGLGAGSPGYATLHLAPVPLQGLEHARAVQDTPYGRAETGWSEQADGTVLVHAQVPANTTAEVALPGRDPFVVGSGRHEWVIEDPRPSRPPAELSWQTSLGAIVDDLRTHRALLAEVEAVDSYLAERLRLHTSWQDNQTLQDTLFGVSADGRRALSAAIDRVNASRTR